MLKFPLAVYAKQLTLYDKELVQFCADYLPENGEILPFQDFPHFRTLGMKEIYKSYGRLWYFGLMEKHDADNATISLAVLDLVNAWKNPPPPDYRDQVTKWFWSKPWSVALYVLVVGLPAVLGWVVMFKALLDWLRATQ